MWVQAMLGGHMWAPVVAHAPRPASSSGKALASPLPHSPVTLSPRALWVGPQSVWLCRYWHWLDTNPSYPDKRQKAGPLATDELRAWLSLLFTRGPSQTLLSLAQHSAGGLLRTATLSEPSTRSGWSIRRAGRAQRAWGRGCQPGRAPPSRHL